MDPSHIPYRLAAQYLRQALLKQNVSEWPRVGIVCGSGLAGLAQTLTRTIATVPYADIPGFPEACTVHGHLGEVVLGYMDNNTDNNDNDNENSNSSSSSATLVICFRGRFHMYEGHSPHTTALPIRVMRCLQVQVVILTNAAGGLNPDYNVGDILPISNHIGLPCLTGQNPFMGPNDECLGPRFPATSNAYCPELRHIAQQAKQKLNYQFVRTDSDTATYCLTTGPMYESPAECQLLRQLGGDCVGMSTIPEVLAAHHAGIQVLCLSLITNAAVMTNNNNNNNNTDADVVVAASHEEVLEAVQKRSVQMQTLVTEIVHQMAISILPTVPALEPIDLTVPPREWREIVRQHLPAVSIAGALLAVGFVWGKSVPGKGLL